MSKELEALERLKENSYYVDDKNMQQDVNTIEQALNRLEAIDNANPSEALKCLRSIEADLIGLPKHITEYDDIFDDYLDDIEDNIDKIEQALLKAQEPKKYLTWEDLEFSNELKALNVKMNNNDYILRYTISIFGCDCCFLYDRAKEHHIELNKQFFNDLHLERVEE